MSAAARLANGLSTSLPPRGIQGGAAGPGRGRAGTAMERISTDQIHIGRRRRYWEDAVSAIYIETAVTLDDQAQFYGRIDWRKIGGVVLSDISSSRQSVVRESRHIRRAEQDLIQINFQLEGTGIVAQDNREAATRPGEIVVYDSSRPYEMHFDGPFRQLSVDFPRDMLNARFGRAETFTARTFSGREGAGRFLYSYVKALVRQAAEDDLLIASRLQDHLVDLLVTAFSGMAQDGTGSGSVNRTMTLYRVKTWLNEHLRDPALSPTTVAQAQGLSLRYLYDLFEDEDMTVWRYIQQTRLDRCRADIENAALFGRSLSEIGFSWGFNDPAHFSRAFRGRFAMTPRECRAARKAALAAG